MPPIAQELVESSLEKAGATDALAIADGSSVPQLALAAASPASGKSKEAAKMLHSAVACEARTRLRNKTALVARSGLDTLRKIVTMRNKELNKAENDLTYLKEMLADVQQPLVEASWKDRVESWIELAALLPKLRSERGVAVLECVFADAEVAKALGLAKMFLNATGTTPDSLMVILNQSLGKHIKANAYRYRRSIDGELAAIKRIYKNKETAFQLLWAFSTAAMIGVFSFISRMSWAYYGEDILAGFVGFQVE